MSGLTYPLRTFIFRRCSTTKGDELLKFVRALVIGSVLAFAGVLLVNQQANADILAAIARCESGNRQFGQDGRVVHNRHSTAIGKFQFLRMHLKRARAHGWDLYSEAGNTAYARYVLRTEGTAPWNASKHCWKRIASR